MMNSKVGKEELVLKSVLDEKYISVEEGIKNCGSEELYVSLLEDFYNIIDLKYEQIVKFLEQGDIQRYTVEVHALKSSARLIGAMELSAAFAGLESFGKNNDIENIKEGTPKVLEDLKQYKKVLEVISGGGSPAEEVSISEIIQCLQKIYDAVDMFDIDEADEAMRMLEKYQMPDCCKKQAERLKAYMADVAMDDILQCTYDMIQSLKSMM